MAVGMSAARVIWVLLSDICNLYWVKFKIWDRDRKYIMLVNTKINSNFVQFTTHNYILPVSIPNFELLPDYQSSLLR